MNDFLERYKDNKDMDEPVREQNEKDVLLDPPMENPFHIDYQTEYDQFDFNIEKSQKKMLREHKLKEDSKAQLIPDITQWKASWINKVLLSQRFAELYEYGDLLIDKLVLKYFHFFINVIRIVAALALGWNLPQIHGAYIATESPTCFG
jgi:hypothetical protein